MSQIRNKGTKGRPEHQFRRLWLGIIVSSTVALTACGGGGGGTDSESIVGGQVPVEQTPSTDNDDSVPSDNGSSWSDSAAKPQPAPQPEDEQGQQQVQGSAQLSWVPPLERVDGESLALNEIGGYRIYYGTVANPTSQVVDIDDPSVTSYTINGLSAASYSFSVTAYDSDGRESAHSNALSKTIN